MTGAILAWVLAGLCSLWSLRYLVRRWRSVQANPARGTLPIVLASLALWPVVRVAWLPFSFVDDDGRSILLTRPGIGVAERGDVVALQTRQVDRFDDTFLVGLPGDRVTIAGKAVEVNGAPLRSFPWAPLQDLTGCEEQVVTQGQLAVVGVADEGDCSSIAIVDAKRFRGREVFVYWPPWAMGRPRWTQAKAPPK